MKISRMMTNHITEPIGFETGRPLFTWLAEDAAGLKRSACQIRIATDPEMKELVFDSQKREDISPLGFEAEFDPEPATRYFWEVTEWDDTGDVGSGTSWFETPEEKLTGEWIGSDDFQSPYFMKKFDLEEDVVSARLYITGVGLFEAYINGERVGDEYLTPFYNDYNHWIQMVTFDVTSQVQKGENAIGVILGNGWYMGRFGFVDRMKELYGDKQAFAMDLVIRTKDGKETRISSDHSFAAHESPFLENSIYDGEVYDSRLELADFAKSSLELSGENGWKNVVARPGLEDRVRHRLSPYLRIQQALRPVEVIHTPAGETVLDFGQEMVGLLEFTCREAAGTEILLQCGEILQNENFYNDNLRTATEELKFIADGTEKTFRSHFTFYGLRYLKVSGVSDVRPEDFTAYVLHSEMEDIGEIETDNAKINRLILNAKWGQKGNFVDVPTDCPQRDERMGWTGDAQVFCATASFNSYTPAFYRKFMRDMLLEQQEEWHQGNVPFVVPDILGQIHRILFEQGKEKERDTTAGSTAWGDAAAVIPWTLYEFYGDASLLREQYSNMTGWVDWMQKIDTEKCGNTHLFSTEFTFGDWLALDNYHQGSSFGGTDNTYVSTAYYFYSAKLTARAARILGYEKDAEKYTVLAEEIRAALQEEFFTASGRCACDTQTALVLALWFDFIPEEYKTRAIADLKQKIVAEGMHLTTGFVGTAYLCKTLSENGLGEIAYNLLLNEDFPSWLYEVNMGATTIWERWNSVLPDGSISDTGMNSLNHYSYGAVLEWMYRYMGGIRPDPEAPGFTHFYLAPTPDKRFRRCTAGYRSAMGQIKSAWERTENGLVYRFEVPFDTTCTLRTPEDLGSGLLEGEGLSETLAAGTEKTLHKGTYSVKFS